MDASNAPEGSKRLVTLAKEGFRAEVQLTMKFGVWFITGAKGDLRLGYDFGIKNDSWGITEVAIDRVARKLGLTVSEFGQTRLRAIPKPEVV